MSKSGFSVPFVKSKDCLFYDHIVKMAKYSLSTLLNDKYFNPDGTYYTISFIKSCVIPSI